MKIQREEKLQLFSNGGYQPNTPEEIRQNLQELFTQKVPNFTSRPADLQSNIIDAFATGLIYVEQQLGILFNAYSPSFAPDFLFELRAAEQGLRRKGAFKSSVDIQFKGSPYSLIPANTGVTGTDLPTYTILEDVMIPSTGSILVTAYCNDITIPTIGVGALNTITTNLKGITASNISTPTEPQEQESMDTFRKRVQAIWRNPRGGSYEYLLNQIQAIEGVDSRAVRLNISGNSVELVVAGGETSDIAFTMMRAGGITPILFVSNPSQSQTNRTVTQNLILNNQPIPYKFTRPLNVQIGIKVNLPLTNITATNNAVESVTQMAMEDYINNLKVGTPVNIASLTQVFIKAFEATGGSAININANTINFEVTNLTQSGTINFNSQGFLELQNDWYLTLSQYSVVING